MITRLPTAPMGIDAGQYHLTARMLALFTTARDDRHLVKSSVGSRWTLRMSCVPSVYQILILVWWINRIKINYPPM